MTQELSKLSAPGEGFVGDESPGEGDEPPSVPVPLWEPHPVRAINEAATVSAASLCAERIVSPAKVRVGHRRTNVALGVREAQLMASTKRRAPK